MKYIKISMFILFICFGQVLMAESNSKSYFKLLGGPIKNSMLSEELFEQIKKYKLDRVCDKTKSNAPYKILLIDANYKIKESIKAEIINANAIIIYGHKNNVAKITKELSGLTIVSNTIALVKYPYWNVKLIDFSKRIKKITNPRNKASIILDALNNERRKICMKNIKNNISKRFEREFGDTNDPIDLGFSNATSTTVDEDSHNFECPVNKALTGIRHSGDENGETVYTCSSLYIKNVSNGEIILKNPYSLGSDEESSSSFTCEGFSIMVGRNHRGDENGDSYMKCAYPYTKDGKRIKPIIEHYDSQTQSSSNFDSTSYNMIMVKRSHYGDENADTNMTYKKLAIYEVPCVFTI
ncbi:hypothetical protein [Zooshikella sp. RANM57]|uniref:hypothetical protein n=1 Tax=Zooshikella sp. RANM57 TaxID=3425863 RepID=UPI003D6F4503